MMFLNNAAFAVTEDLIYNTASRLSWFAGRKVVLLKISEAGRPE